MENLLKCSSIRWSDTFKTAAIVSTERAIHLCFNQNFVETYCQFDTDLMMLVLHELHHILYGHTSLFPEAGPAHNIAFDAIINARLCRHWKEPENSNLFIRFYKDAPFPAFLLTPPPAWPRMPGRTALEKERIKLEKELDPLLADKALELRNKLYYDPNFDVSYDDILSLLNRCGDQFCSRNKVICLGNHPGKSDSQDPEGTMKDALLASLAVNMQTEISRGIGPGGQISSLSPEAKRVNPHRKFLNVLHATLIKAGLYKNTSLPIFKAMPSPTPVETPIPQWKDRTFFTRKCLYPVQPILYHGLRNEHKRSAQFGQKVHLYLDVSYSMCDNLPWIVSALAPLEQAGWCRIFLFSTRVFPAPKEGIAQEELKTTGGTDISCVLQHIVEWEPRTRPAKIMILTDGYFRVPIGTLMDQFKNTKVKIFGAITRNGSKSAMEAIAVYTVLMPEYR